MAKLNIILGLFILTLTLMSCDKKEGKGDNGGNQTSKEMGFGEIKNEARKKLLKDKALKEYARLFADKLCEKLSKSEWKPKSDELQKLYDIMVSANDLEDGQRKVKEYIESEYAGRGPEAKSLAQDFNNMVNGQNTLYNRDYKDVVMESSELQDFFRNYKEKEIYQATAYLLKTDSECPYLANFLESVAMKEK